MNTSGFGRSHFNPAPSIFSAFRSASTSSRLNSIAEFLAAPAFIPWIFFRLICLHYDKDSNSRQNTHSRNCKNFGSNGIPIASDRDMAGNFRPL